MALVPGEDAHFMKKILDKGVSEDDKRNYKEADRLTMFGKRFPGGYIDDSEAVVRGDIPKETTTMSKVLNHPKLYEYYPELAQRKAMPNVSLSEAASYDTEDKNFRFNTIGADGKLKRGNVLHETQHGVQDLDGDIKENVYNDTKYELLNYMNKNMGIQQPEYVWNDELSDEENFTAMEKHSADRTPNQNAFSNITIGLGEYNAEGIDYLNRLDYLFSQIETDARITESERGNPEDMDLARKKENIKGLRDYMGLTAKDLSQVEPTFRQLRTRILDNADPVEINELLGKLFDATGSLEGYDQ